MFATVSTVVINVFCYSLSYILNMCLDEQGSQRWFSGDFILNLSGSVITEQHIRVFLGLCNAS